LYLRVNYEVFGEYALRENLFRKQRLMRKLAIGFVVVLLICLGLYLRFHHRRRPSEAAYVGSRQVTIWSSSAQVKEAVASANFGDRVEVLTRAGDQAQVRTASGAVGWVDGDELLSDEFWRKAKTLLAETGARPVEGKGRTRVISNLHMDPERDSPHVSQLDKGVPIELYERRAAAVPQSAPAAQPGSPADPSSTPAPARREDWWLVKAKPNGQAEIAGWLLGRFVSLDIPSPLPDYADAAGVRIVAWFELNRVPDEKNGLTPQYLVLGIHGAEGQPCDFTLMRAYTWDERKGRYETAFVESDLCGKLPVELIAANTPGGNASFAFEDWSHGTAEKRSYRMTSTVIRRVRPEASSAPVHSRKH
jgi:hypothetical protein